MVAGAGDKAVFAARLADAASGGEHHVRPLVVRLVVEDDLAAAFLQFRPVFLEGFGLLDGIVAVDHLALPRDAGGDELLADLLEHRAALGVV